MWFILDENNTVMEGHVFLTREDAEKHMTRNHYSAINIWKIVQGNIQFLIEE